MDTFLKAPGVAFAHVLGTWIYAVTVMKIALVGYGKMGKAIEAQALKRGHEVVVRMHSRNAGQLTDSMLKEAEIAIEFTRPEAAWTNVTRLLGLGIPVVCGTTGWDAHIPKAEIMARDRGTGFLHAHNFSLGVQLFFALNRHLARLMGGQADYRLGIQEIHHTQKKDAPSGTALRMARDIIEVSNRWEDWVLVEGEAVEGHSEKVPIRALRQDPVPGTHEVFYTSEIDEIRIAHQAFTRDGFAKGAVVAAEFLLGKRGSFTMKDVLGLE